MDSKPSLLRCLLKTEDMESVNLDMEDIFEEDAGEEDFASVGPLPDLPDREEGGAEGEQDEENTDVMSKLKDLSKGAAKKVVRKPMPKLDGQRLTGERGIPILPKVFEKVQFKGKGHEGQDLRIIMRYLEHWAHRLFPMMPFDEVLERIEKLGTKKEVQTCIKKMRLDMPLLNDDYLLQNSDDEAAGSDNEKSSDNRNDVQDQEGEWDEIIKDHAEEQKMSQTPTSKQQPSTPMSQLKSQLSKPLQDLNATPQPYTATPIANSCSPGGLTPEQRERIERNKQIALEKKMGKQGFKVPAVPNSPFRTPKSPAPQRSPVIHSPCRTSPHKQTASSTLSSPAKQNNATFSSLVQITQHSDTELSGSTLTSCTQLNGGSPATSVQHNSIDNIDSQAENEMSEVIPVIGNGQILSSQTSQAAMSEIIPPQDLKRHIDTNSDHDLPKKQKIVDELSEDEILSSLENN